MRPDHPLALLQAWTALEALSPQTFKDAADFADGDRKRIAWLNETGLPWLRQEKAPPKTTLYYQVVLGCISMFDATSGLARVFGLDEEAYRGERKWAAVAAVMVDAGGRVLSDNGVGVSSFAWALPKALAGDLAGLGAWGDVEHGIVAGLTERLRGADEQEPARPLDAATIARAFDWLAAELDLAPGMCDPPSFAVRVFHPLKAHKPPEAGLLNSFFLADLARAAALLQGGSAGSALARYLGLVRVDGGANLLADHARLEALVAPQEVPAARWPGPGGHPLVTLQQAAVNAARRELGGAQGIVAVNGPPGTGKTTLLRDIVAANVLERAIAMAAFDDPQAAFRHSGQKAGQFDLYRLDGSLRGQEMVVASSNNKAVENVSRELPARKAIGRDMRYFRTISDRLMQVEEDGAKVEDTGEEQEEDEAASSWGLIAAVLGNAANRQAFARALWWDNDFSLRQYLKAARGEDVRIEWRNPATGEVERVKPAVVVDEAPPTPEQARANWQEAREAFTSLHAQVRAELAELEAVRRASRQPGLGQQALQGA